MDKHDQLEELLVDWEQQRRLGKELTVEEVCKNSPELVSALSKLIRDLKATDWLEVDDDSDDDFLQLPDLSTVSNHADETQLLKSTTTLDQFCRRLVDSELMDAGQVEKHRKDYAATDAVAFARQLVDRKKLTRFQATVLIEGRDLPLVLDRYVLLGEIGAGGMGAVYKALHQQMDRVVALKILPKEAVDSPDKVKRFQREVKAAAKLEHSNIVTAFDAHESKGIHFLVMSYVGGSDLSAVVRKQGLLSAAKAVNYIGQAARGLEHAHNMGIVHRDIKPANLLLDKQGTVKILDMGLARIDNADPEHDKTVSQELTQDGMVMGTIAYLAPEQALDTRSADARSDMYSLGCTLYYLLTGKALYNEDTMLKTIMAHREGAIPSLCEERSGVPVELDAIFHKMVAKKPEDRFQNMTELLSAMETLDIRDEDGQQPVVASLQAMHNTATFTDTSREYLQPTVIQSDSRKPPKRRWGLIAGGLFGLVLLLGLIIKLQTPAGTVVLEIDQPELIGAVVTIDGEKKITIKTGKDKEIIEITPDEKRHELEVKLAGFKTFTKEFTFDTGNKQTIKVRLEPVEKAQPAVASSGQNQNTQTTDPYARDREAAEWVLSVGGAVGAVYPANNLNQFRMEQPVDIPSTPFVIRHIDLGKNEGVGWGSLQILSGLPSLTNLDIRSTAIDISSSFEQIALPQLNYFRMEFTRNKTSALRQLSGIRSIRELHISGDQIDDDWKFLNRMPQLRELTVWAPVPSLEPLSEFPQLRHLYLPDTSLNKAKKAEVDKLLATNPRLTITNGWAESRRFAAASLTIAAMMELIDDGFLFSGRYLDRTENWSSVQKPIEENRPFSVAYIKCPEHQQITARQAELLSTVNCCNKISAWNCVGVQALLEVLDDFSLVRSLNIGSSDITDSSFEFLSNRAELQELDLRGTKVTRLGIEGFKSRMPTCVVFSDFGTFPYEHKVLPGWEAASEEPTAYTWPTDQPAPAIAPFTPEEAKQHQEEWAKHLGVPVEMENSIGMKFRVIPPGEFMMGSSEEEIVKLLQERALKEREGVAPDWYKNRVSNEGPQHRVMLAKPFAAGIHEVTRGQFRRFVEATGYRTDAENSGMGGFRWEGAHQVQAPGVLWNTSPGFVANDEHPVVNISWNDAMRFCDWLTDKERFIYRLFTEAEWEFACRAGSLGRFNFGDDESKLPEYGKCQLGGRVTHPVGKHRANSFGLFDLHGNVWEWCMDEYAPYSVEPSVNPIGSGDKEGLRVMRGGSYVYPATDVRSTVRDVYHKVYCTNDVGFRIVRTFEKYEPKKEPELTPTDN